MTKAEIFLSYTEKDREQVEQLYQGLIEAGFKPWMDVKDILPGEDWKSVVIDSIRRAPFFLACLSKNSVNKRGVIQEELREALEVWKQKLWGDIYLIPLRLDSCEVPKALAQFQWVNLFEEDGFRKLVQAIKTGMERLGLLPITPIKLRSYPINNLLKKDVEKMLKEKDFYDGALFWLGSGIEHKYEEVEHNGERLIVDYATSLYWQISESEQQRSFGKANEYIEKLNAGQFGGYADWRLPTLEEAMSLMEARIYPDKRQLDLPRNYHDRSVLREYYINPVFYVTQAWIWTADRNSNCVWVVFYDKGHCDCVRQDYVTWGLNQNARRIEYCPHVRAVRSNTKI